MLKQSKDKLYDEFLKDPTKDKFRQFLKENCGELNEVDFKEKWIEKGHLAKTLLSMANSHGGVIVVGVREEDDGTITPVGLETFKDKAVINNEIAKYIPSGLDYEIYNYNYDSSEYSAVENKKFQLLMIYDRPERLPFISSNATTDLEKDIIYVRRGTKCQKATADEIERMIESKISTIFKETSDLTLEEHLSQLKLLYNELPKKIKHLVRKGEPSLLNTAIYNAFKTIVSLGGSSDEYEEIDNPDYPEESYEAFILRMIKGKKLKIEKVLDLK